MKVGDVAICRCGCEYTRNNTLLIIQKLISAEEAMCGSFIHKGNEIFDIKKLRVLGNLTKLERIIYGVPDGLNIT